MAQDELQKLINLISRLPGVGQRSAQRIALYLIKNKQELMLPLGESVKETAAKVRKCEICGMLDVNLPTKICSSDTRIKNTICIVEDMADVWAFERSGFYKRQYHVIGGLLSASKNFTEQDLQRLADLADKLDSKGCKVMLSNSQSKKVEKLFSSSKWKIKKITAKRAINSDTKNRTGHFEILIKNY